MKERISAFFNTRAFFIVFSLIASILLWAYIGYGENRDEDVRLSNVNIQYLHSEVLTENNLVVTGIEPSNLNLLLSGKRNTVMKLNNSNVSAVADLAEIIEHSASTGSYLLRYTMVFPEGIDESSISVSSASVDYVTVTVEKLVSNTLSIDAIYDGGPADGYSAEPVRLSQNSVTVSGPDSLISQISKVEARFTAYDFSSEIKQIVPLTLLDKDGNELSQDGINMDINAVTATIPVIMVKEIPLEVQFTACNSANSSNITCDIMPKTITLAGDADILRDINTISLGTIDLNGFNLSYSDVFSIKVPNGLTNMTGMTSATVTIGISGVDITRLSVTNIDYKNETAGLYYKIVTQSLDVVLRGSDASLENVAENNVRIVADLAELGNAVGTFSVPAKVYVDGYPDIDATGSYKVTVSVSNEPFSVDDDVINNG